MSESFVSKDKKEMLFTYIQKTGSANSHSEAVRLSGLRPDYVYVLEDGRRYYGSELMEVGFVIDKLYGDGQGKMYYFKAEEA